MIRTLLTTAAIMAGALFALPAFAAEKEPFIYVVNSGSPTGTFNAITRAYSEDLEQYYEKVKFVHARGCAKAAQVTGRLDKPTLTLWEGPQYSLYLDGKNDVCAIDINKKNFLRADLKYNWILVNPNSGLTLEDLKSDQRRWTVGHDVPKSSWESFLDQMESELGNELQSVTYESSGNASLALVSGEVDFLITNTKQAIRYIEQGKMKPIATLNPEGTTYQGKAIPAVESFADFPLASAGRSEFILGLNMTKEEREHLDRSLREIHNDPESAASQWYATAGYTNSFEFEDDVAFDKAMDLVEIWRE